MGAFDFLFGYPAPNIVRAGAPSSYPTPEDATYARSVGAFYGSPLDAYASGKAATVLGERTRMGLPVPVSGVGRRVSELAAEQSGVPLGPPAEFSKRTGQAVDGSALADMYARAALASNRSAIAALGLDPRHVTLDAVTDPSSVNVQGAYYPSSDRIFSTVGRDSDAASTLTHEALHRGMEQLRRLPGGMPPLHKALRAAPAEQMRVPEEYVIRHIMRSRLGDPETSPAAVRQADAAENAFFTRDSVTLSGMNAYIDELEAAAANELARRRPRGPR